MNIHDFKKFKMNDTKISMITCYDHWSAQIVNSSPIDCILVGDSLAMVVYGEKTTLNISTKEIARHVRAVSLGAPDKFIIADLPFLSYRKSLHSTMKNVGLLMKAGAQAVKLEGAPGNLDSVRHIVESGIPVVGHLGLTPQMINGLGGYKVQGKKDQQAQLIQQQAYDLQQAGCFSLVLECVPCDLAKTITEQLEIPTIGIGAGQSTNGQVLVMQDLLGVYDKNPKFVRKFNCINDHLKTAFQQFDHEVKKGSFPSEKESYS